MINTVWNFRGRRGEKHTTIFNTAETTIIPGYINADGTPVYADLYGLVVSNTSGSDCNVTIRDAVDGPIRDVIAVKAGTAFHYELEPELGAKQQTLPNNDWTATLSAGVSNIEISALFRKNT